MMLEKRRILVIIAFLVFCVLLLPGVVAAADPDVVYVNTTGNDDNPGTLESPKLTILNATDTVASGGFVFIGKGIYKGDGNRNINITKDMIITGENQQNTIIDAEGTNRIFHINNNVTLMNLTLRNGYSDENGGAIYIESGNFLTVINSTFTNNNAGVLGGAIYNYGTLNVLESAFKNNNGGAGGAIHSDIGANLAVVLSTFTNNKGDRAGAIECKGETYIINSTFKNNYARASGGALFFSGVGNATVISSTFTNNTAQYSGGAILNGADLIVIDSTFTRNSVTDATWGGGAIYNTGHATVNFNKLIGNTAAGDGDELYNGGGAYLDATNNWWGSNDDPSWKTAGILFIEPRIVAPTVTSTDPKNNTVNVPANKVIKITFNQNIKMGSGWIELKKGSTIIKTTNSISGNVLTIKPSSNLSPGDYVVVIHTGSVTEEIGIPVALFSTKFKVAASSKATISQILAAAATVKSYYEKNRKLPSTVTINGSKVSMPKFLYLLSQATIQINSGKTASITIKNVNTPPKESGKIKSGKIVKKDFVNIAKNVVNFINTKGRVPNYVSTKLGNMKYTKVICMFSNVLSFYKTNKRLPNYVSMKK